MQDRDQPQAKSGWGWLLSTNMRAVQNSSILPHSSDVYWKGSGPLFFYTGNEGAIEEFYDNTGFLFELAQNFSALIVFAEHVSQFVYYSAVYIHVGMYT